MGWFCPWEVFNVTFFGGRNRVKTHIFCRFKGDHSESRILKFWIVFLHTDPAKNITSKLGTSLFDYRYNSLHIDLCLNRNVCYVSIKYCILTISVQIFIEKRKCYTVNHSGQQINQVRACELFMIYAGLIILSRLKSAFFLPRKYIILKGLKSI